MKGYDLLSFARKFVDKYGNRLTDTAAKQKLMLQKLLEKKLFKNR